MARRKRASGPIQRNSDGLYVLTISDDERTVIGELLSQLEQLVADPNNPAVRRLFPTAYPNDPERNQEYVQLMHEELSASKIAAIATAQNLLQSDEPLTEGEVMAFMQVVNSLRLVLGTLLDVGENDDELPDPDEPNAASWHLYAYLGWMLEWIVEELGSQFS